MFIIMAVWGVAILFMGFYSIRMTKQSDYGWLCCVIGVILAVVGFILPVTAIVDAFKEKEIAAAIICIVIYVSTLIGLYFFVKNLWRY